MKAALAAAYKTNLLDNVINEVKGQNDLCNQPIENPCRETNHIGDWPTTWWQQFTVLLERGLKQRRHDSFSGVKIGQIIIVSLLCGLLWWQTNISLLQDQVLGFIYIYMRLDTYIALKYTFVDVIVAIHEVIILEVSCCS